MFLYDLHICMLGCTVEGIEWEGVKRNGAKDCVLDLNVVEHLMFHAEQSPRLQESLERAITESLKWIALLLHRQNPVRQSYENQF